MIAATITKIQLYTYDPEAPDFPADPYIGSLLVSDDRQALPLWCPADARPIPTSRTLAAIILHDCRAAGCASTREVDPGANGVVSSRGRSSAVDVVERERRWRNAIRAVRRAERVLDALKARKSFRNYRHAKDRYFAGVHHQMDVRAAAYFAARDRTEENV